MDFSLSRAWHTPTYSSLLSDRRDSIVVLGAAGIHFALSLAGLPSWTCPFRTVLGIPCPGCGLTTAALQFVRGDVVTSLHTHAFAPIFLLAFLLMGISLVLPEIQRKTFLNKIASFETHSGITAWILLFLMLYWAFRLIA